MDNLINSYMRLRVYYSIDDGTTFKQTNVYQDYKFDHSTSSTADNNGFEWDGSYKNGDPNYSYNKVWRYRSYIFKPSKFTITAPLVPRSITIVLLLKVLIYSFSLS